MKVQFVVQPKSGLSYHRLINPMEFFEWDEGDSGQMLYVVEDEHLIDGTNGDILYFNKFIGLEAPQLHALQKKGVKIVVDVDDSWDIPPGHPFYQAWKDRGNREKVIENIKLADLVICATDRLQKKVRELNKNTAVIPNAFPFGYDVYVPNPGPRQKMSFIYVAGSTHLPDVKLLDGKFKRIGGDQWIKDRAEFILAGYEPTMIPKYKTKEDYEARNGNIIMTKVPNVWDKMAHVFSQTNSHRILNGTNLDEYINFYDQADVAIVPLCQSDWNSYKSELKIVEAAVKGIPVICSSVEPYSNLRPCEGVMWVDNNDQWLEWFKYCIKNPNYVKEQGAKLNAWVSEEYDLLKWNQVRKELFKSLIAK
jgi:glycosyltransferase involved in cell wall biosynthesis